MMMSSSASRREGVKSSELGRAGVGESPRPSSGAMARSGELPKGSAAAVRHEGWMLRYGRRKIDRSFVRTRYFVLDNKLLAYYKKQPKDNMIPATKYLMELVAIDWFKDIKRMDHVARWKGCAAQVAAEKGMFTFVVNIQIHGSNHYSLVLYFVTRTLEKGSLLQRFADGDDNFRNSRLKLIPSVPKRSWIVRRSFGSTPCLLGKAVNCSYIRGPEYIEVDVDIGSSEVTNGVLGLVFGVVTTLVVDIAFLIQANTYDELPEQLLGAARLSNIEPNSAIVSVLDNSSSGE